MLQLSQVEVGTPKNKCSFYQNLKKSGLFLEDGKNICRRYKPKRRNNMTHHIKYFLNNNNNKSSNIKTVFWMKTKKF